eukprot:CAMPEP_0194266968 /NCGR_PEP_ID=MMETSP0169-20130528/1676_1 /TAXON_ID=218684 /ORGANISM="Corethron pennatum, Strain L29A3" /LENGTH=266 /DNA_ID=CAMNT_0039007753 /DNA_START=74 /DNA_END=874 /DNA_ORIENTATION=+
MNLYFRLFLSLTLAAGGISLVVPEPNDNGNSVDVTIRNSNSHRFLKKKSSKGKFKSKQTKKAKSKNNLPEKYKAISTINASGESTYTVTFDDGFTGGWGINGLDIIEETGGNKGGHLPFAVNAIFFLDITNPSIPYDITPFSGNYFSAGVVQLSIDFMVNYIEFVGKAVSRDLFLALKGGNGEVYLNGGPLPKPKTGWHTMTFNVPLQEDMPPGWVGFEDATYGDVIREVDEVAFTTAEPGQAYGYHDWDVSIDNISITVSGDLKL